MALLLAALCACAKPEPNPDGKPVAISPMGSRESVDGTKVARPVEPPAVRGPSLTLADFEKGAHDGTYLQERCADGLRGTTVVEGSRLSLRTEIFYDAKCKEAVETTLSVWRLGSIQGNVADLVPLRETRTLWLESEVSSANDPQSPVCAVGWRKGVERDIGALGDCSLDAGFHTLLSIEGEKLRWGATGQDPGTNEILDGSRPVKRHRKLEELPYLKQGNTAQKAPGEPSATATGTPTAAATITPDPSVVPTTGAGSR